MAQPVAYYPDGSPVPEEDWENAVQSGAARWEGGQELKAVRPDGTRVSVPAEEYQRALASGYRIASPMEVAAAEREQRHGTVGQGALAAAEGAARGLTFGLSDQAGAALGGEEWAEAARARQEVNPTAAAAGEIAGAVAPILFTGGAGAGGLAARGARVAGALPRGAAELGGRAGALAERLAARQGGGALNRIVQRTAGGAAEAAAEGALYGVGQAISDNALRDAELAADKLLAAAGEGALFSGLLGGALGGTVGAAGVGLSKARDATLARLGEKSTQDALRTFAERRAFRQVVGNYKKPFSEAAAKGEGTLERAGRKLLDEGAPIRKADEFLPWAEKRTQRAADELKAVAAKLDEAGVKLDGQNLLRRADEIIQSYRDRGLGDFEKVAKRLEKKIEPLRNALDPKAPKAAKEAAERIEYDLTFGARVVKPDAPPAPAAKEFSFSDFWKLRQDLDKTIKWGKQSGDIATDGVRELRDAFKAELDDMIERGSGGADLKKAWQKASEDYGDFALLRKHAEEYKQSRDSNRAISLTDYLAGVGGAATGNIAGVASAGAIALANKAAREQGNYWLATMANRLSRFEGRFELATQALAGIRKAADLRKAIAPAVTSIPERFRETRQQVQQMQDPRAAVEVLARTAEGFDDRPDILRALHERVLGDSQYLQAQLPPTLGRAGNSLTPQLEQARVPLSAMRSFLRKADALADPLRVVEDLAEGKLDRDAIETLKVRRPRLFDAVREQVVIYTAQRGDTLPYQQRVLLGLAFDFTSDASLSPENIAAIQQSYAERGQEGGVTPPGRPLDPRAAQSNQLPAERAIGGNA